jgi:hypothetical protein
VARGGGFLFSSGHIIPGRSAAFSFFGHAHQSISDFEPRPRLFVLFGILRSKSGPFFDLFRQSFLLEDIRAGEAPT